MLAVDASAPTGAGHNVVIGFLSTRQEGNSQLASDGQSDRTRGGLEVVDSEPKTTMKRGPFHQPPA